MKTQRLLFIYITPTTFVKTDREILSSAYRVDDYCFRPVHGLARVAIEMIRQFFFLAVHIRTYDKVFVWFADYHSLLPVLFARVARKPVYVVIGGYDICRDRSLRYGAFYSAFRGFFTATSIKQCTLNLTVSHYVDRKVAFVFPNVRRRMIHNCIHIASDGIIPEKEKMVLCVALIDSQRTYTLKGLDTFFEIAALMPGFEFVMVGIHDEALSLFPANLPANVSLRPKVPHHELATYYQRAGFYCQLSRSEIFGVSIGEAMLYGCIPLVTNVGGMPEVVGEEGVVVRRDAVEIASQIRRLSEQDTSLLRVACRQRIEKYFSYKRRSELLLDAVK
jgi:glycosyltransferase involved in cell wall biosynthesis